MMNRSNNVKIFKLLLLLVLAGTFHATISSCEKSETPPPDEDNELEDPNGRPDYAVWMILGSYPDRAFYALGTDDLSSGSITAEGNGAEITSQADEGIIAHNGKYYYPSTLTDFGKFSVYEFKDNRFNIEKEVPYTYMSPNSYAWVDDNTLLMIGANADRNKLIYSEVDINTLEITNGEFELPEIPEGYLYYAAGNFEFVNDKLFIAYTYNADWPDLAAPGLRIAVFDYPGLELEKVIETSDANGRGFSNIYSSPGSCVDENGDVYMMFIADWSTPEDSPHMIFKIPSGTTELDPDYRFDLKEAVGEDILRMWYVGDSKAIVRYADSGIQAADSETAYYYKYALIDLEAKSLVKKLDLPPTNLGNITTSNEGKAYIAIHAETDQDYVWEVNKNTGEVTQGLKLETPSDGLIRLDNLQ